MMTKDCLRDDDGQCGCAGMRYTFDQNQKPSFMKLVENIGNADRTVRLTVSAVIVFLFAAGLIGGPLAAALLSLSAILVLTALVGFCPLYELLGIASRKRRAS